MSLLTSLSGDSHISVILVLASIGCVFPSSLTSLCLLVDELFLVGTWMFCLWCHETLDLRGASFPTGQALKSECNCHVAQTSSFTAPGGPSAAALRGEGGRSALPLLRWVGVPAPSADRSPEALHPRSPRQVGRARGPTPGCSGSSAVRGQSPAEGTAASREVRPSTRPHLLMRVSSEGQPWRGGSLSALQSEAFPTTPTFSPVSGPQCGPRLSLPILAPLRLAPP